MKNKNRAFRFFFRLVLTLFLWHSYSVDSWAQCLNCAALAADIFPGADGSSPGDKADFLIEVGGKLYFDADDGVNGIELWSYDPATCMATLAADINPGVNDSKPGDKSLFLIEVAGKLYFGADDGVNGRELWCYDPATGMANLAADIRAGSISSEPGGASDFFIEVGGKLYFDADNGVVGKELWSYDPATGMATLVADIRAGSSGSTPGGDADFFIEVGGKIYFDANGNGRELWVYDPVTGTASQAADIRPGSGGSSPGRDSDFFIEVGGKLYFDADDGVNGKELWSYDLVTGTASLAADINPSGDSKPGGDSDFFIEVGGKLYFDADDGVNGIELWSYDPATGMASLAADINPSGDSKPGGDSDFFVEIGGKLYFDADDGVNGKELWCYDTATGMAILAADIRSGASGSSPGGNSDFLIEVDGKLYFDANDGVNGRELWSYDPATGVAIMAADINSTGSSSPGGNSDFFIEVGGELYFDASDGVNGRELWVIRDIANTTPAAITVVDRSNCNNVMGTLTMPTNTGCAKGMTFMYSTDNINFSTDLPIYDQNNPITIYTSCDCDLGDARSPVTQITTNPDISISVQPSPQTECAGNDISFSVTAFGATNFSYQWQRDCGNGFQNVGTDNATLNLTNISSTDVCNYQVIVSAPTSSCPITSDVVALVVESCFDCPEQLTACTGDPHNCNPTKSGGVYSGTAAPFVVNDFIDPANMPSSTYTLFYTINGITSALCEFIVVPPAKSANAGAIRN